MTAKYAIGGSFGSLLKDPHFWAPAIAVGAGTLATGAATGVQKLVQAKRRAQAYKEMLDLHPQLKTREQDMVKRIFTSLHRVNPMMGADPMVAGAWVDTIMESGGMDHAMMGQALLAGVKDLAQIRSHVSQAASKETNVPRNVGTAVTNMVGRGFDRHKELTRELGEVGALRKQIEERNEAEKLRHVNEAREKAEKRLNQAVEALHRTAVEKGVRNPDQYTLGVTFGNVPPLSSKATSTRARTVDMSGYTPKTITGSNPALAAAEAAMHGGRSHRFAGGNRPAGLPPSDLDYEGEIDKTFGTRKKKSSLLAAVLRAP